VNAGLCSDHPAVGAQDLALIQEPSGPTRKATAAAMSSGAEPLQRVHLGHAVDQFKKSSVAVGLCGGARAGRSAMAIAAAHNSAHFGATGY
jgi:hypothetical protein